MVVQADEWAQREEMSIQFLHIIKFMDYSYYGVACTQGSEITLDRANQAVGEFMDKLKLKSQWDPVIKYDS